MNNYNVILENIKHELRNKIKQEEKYIAELVMYNDTLERHKLKVETLTEVLNIIAENEINLL